MAILNVHSLEGQRRFSFEPGDLLVDVLRTAEIHLRLACGGRGVCGRCRVSVLEGLIHDPTSVERAKLDDCELAAGVRLACQLTLQNDLTVDIAEAPTSCNWKPLEFDPSEPREDLPVPPSDGTQALLDAAVDLGTTRIKVTVLDQRTGRRLAGRVGQNPQGFYGADIMSRLVAATRTDGEAQRLADLAWNAVGEALRDMLVRDGFCLRNIRSVSVVGNTAMLSLFAGADAGVLLDPANWSRGVDCTPDGVRERAAAQGLGHDAHITIVPPLAGFVGSDLLAGVLAIDLTASEAALFIDFGTNSEIALWDGKTLWVTSAAGGPAFEGSGIACGMEAEPGAVYRVESAPPDSGFRFDVIGGGAARGLCGSGLIDIIALLVDCGMLDVVGRFMAPSARNGFAVRNQEQVLWLAKKDVDLFQRAKAAIGAGVGCLMDHAGVRKHDLTRVCVSGAFGRFLNVPRAQAIGLLPDTGADRVTLHEHAALRGCEQLALKPDRAAALGALRSGCVMRNMAEVPDFERLFVENLYLRPMNLP